MNMIPGSGRLALVGKQGPAFGDRPSATLILFEDDANEVSSITFTNWPSSGRTDALRGALSLVTGPLAENTKTEEVFDLWN